MSVARAVAAPAARRDEPAALAPLLLGALAGSLIAGRLETALVCVAVAFACAVVAGARMPGAAWWRMLAIGAVLAWVLNLYLTPGTPFGWPRVLGRAATREGAALGLLLVVRTAGAFAAVAGLAALWPGERAADALAGGLRPLARLGAPVAEARVMLGLALRFAPLLRLEAARIARVQRLRAGREPRSAAERVARLRAIVVPALTASLERADRVALALEARHYRLRPLVATRRPWTAARVFGTVAGLGLLAGAVLWRPGS